MKIPQTVLMGFLLAGGTTSAVVTVRYVDAGNLNPVPPYTEWGSAATTVQEAVDAAVAGDEIVVTNGVYETGGRAVFGTMTNRVVVDKPVLVRSVNGPEATIIRGGALPTGPNGEGAVRCVYLTNGATLSGFTLTRGATRKSGDLIHEQSGGGAWCEPSTAVVTNCLVWSNTAGLFAGGVLGGHVSHCIVLGNGAAYGSGVSDASLDNCVVRGNMASGSGGGAKVSTLNQCTLVENSAQEFGGGLSHCDAHNCIVYFNTAPVGTNFDDNSTLNRCCTFPTPATFNSENSITNAPLFVDQAGGNVHLQGNSPCVNTGLNANAKGSTDLGGLPRIVGDAVDIGAYEFQGAAPPAFYDWLAQYGLPMDGSADLRDEDLDGHSNWQEWQCGTMPTNAASVLRLLSVTRDNNGVEVQWSSVAGWNYQVERATNLDAPARFSLVASNVAGVAEITGIKDAAATNESPCFYRVGVAR